MTKLEFLVDGQPLLAEVQDLVIAGWTGRDAAAVEEHIVELEAIGVARPRKVPCFYRLGANLLTTDGQLDVTGPDSSGEVEFVLLSLAEGLFVGVGSDHTDRKVEAYGVHCLEADVSQTDWPGSLAIRRGERPLGQPDAALLDYAGWQARALSGGLCYTHAFPS